MKPAINPPPLSEEEKTLAAIDIAERRQRGEFPYNDQLNAALFQLVKVARESLQ